MAAGTASRFVPLSAERPKGLLDVKGEVLIERQMRQLQEAGITDITVVVGYKAEMFQYLTAKYGVRLVLNEDYARYNNTSSLIRVIDRLADTYICSSDNYFTRNVFLESPTESYYSALYAGGETSEYCLTIDSQDNITAVSVGGRDAWYMIGHVFFNAEFSAAFRDIMKKVYEQEETKQGYWEDVYIRYIDQLPRMKVHRYRDDELSEFDSLDELRLFDSTYINDTRSTVINHICQQMQCQERDLSGFKGIKHDGSYLLFSFQKGDDTCCYNEQNDTITQCL